MESQRKNGDQCFVLFHIENVAIGLVRHVHNSKSRASRVH